MNVELGKWLKKRANALGFCGVGFAPPLLEETYLNRLHAAPQPPYVRWAAKDRLDARILLTAARTAVVVAYPYRERMGSQDPAPGRGYFSPFAQAPDYHRLLIGKLYQLAAEISQQVSDFQYAIQVDSGPCSERLWALASGVGWQGKNNFIIVPEFGSFVWLGIMAVNIELQPDGALADECGNCSHCLQACPTKAYLEDNVFEWQRCMAYWTTDKGKLSPGQCRMLGRHRIVYGCDLCQLACPHNCAQGSAGSVPLEGLMNLNAADFRLQFDDTAFWRGRRILCRNAIIAASGGAREHFERLHSIANGAGELADYARGAIKGFIDENN